MATVTLDVNDLPARYAEVVTRAKQGDEVIITAPGEPPVRLVPVPPSPAPRPRVLGLHPGSMAAAPDFDAPLPDEFWLGES
jgi:prevent-host-death family protein